MTAPDKSGARASVLKEAEPRFIFREYDIEICNDGVRVQGGAVFKGVSITKRLEGCAKCAVLAVTLGHGIDRAIRRLQFTDMASAFIYDACANAYIEEVCDKAQEEIAEAARNSGFGITKRYSPGYGDFGLENQAELLRLANAAAGVGISLSADNLLIPQKSVTAVIGLSAFLYKRN